MAKQTNINSGLVFNNLNLEGLTQVEIDQVQKQLEAILAKKLDKAKEIAKERTAWATILDSMAINVMAGCETAGKDFKGKKFTVAFDDGGNVKESGVKTTREATGDSGERKGRGSKDVKVIRPEHILDGQVFHGLAALRDALEITPGDFGPSNDLRSRGWYGPGNVPEGKSAGYVFC